MESKSLTLTSALIMGVLLMGLFPEYTLVEAQCAQSALSCYRRCNRQGVDSRTCWRACHCGTSLNTETGDEADTYETYAANDFCNLGCSSSVCSNIISLHKSAGSLSDQLEENVKKAAQDCNNACFQFCNKKPDTRVVAAI